MKRAFIVIFVVAVVGAAIMTFGPFESRRTGAFERIEPIPESETATLKSYWNIPDFSLTERSGEAVSLADLKGKVWVADLFYSTCPSTCPMISSRLTEIQKAVASEPDVRLVSISTDPEKDTPEALKEYAAKFEATDKWLFLTGDKEAVYALANKGLKLSAVPNTEPGAEEPVTHSTKLALVDRHGMVRGFYEGSADTAPLVKDIHRLLEEK